MAFKVDTVRIRKLWFVRDRYIPLKPTRWRQLTVNQRTIGSNPMGGANLECKMFDFVTDSEFEKARDDYRPFVFRNLPYQRFGWADAINDLNQSMIKNYKIKILDGFGFITHNTAEHIVHLQPVVNDILKLYPGHDYSAHMYMSLSTLTEGFGKHCDHSEVFFWQCEGSTHWKVFTLTGEEEYDINPGDIIYIPTSMPHDVISNSPRVGLSMAIENTKNGV